MRLTSLLHFRVSVKNLACRSWKPPKRSCGIPLRHVTASFPRWLRLLTSLPLHCVALREAVTTVAKECAVGRKVAARRRWWLSQSDASDSRLDRVLLACVRDAAVSNVTSRRVTSFRNGMASGWRSCLLKDACLTRDEKAGMGSQLRVMNRPLLAPVISDYVTDAW